MDYEDHEEEEEEQEAEVGYSDPGRGPTKLPSPVHAPPRKPRYKECQKNHAVGIGAHAVDGCGEFLPAGEDGTLESLKCAACSCHRNFHRREIDGSFPFGQYPHQHQQLLLAHHPHGHFGYRSPTGTGYLHLAAAPQRAAPVAALALPSSSGGGGPGEDMEDYYSNPGSGAAARKRFRTKFTAEQKEKMLSLAERLEWRIQKQDEELVQEFCSEVGIRRHVLKVWMHNNKHTLGKKI